MGLLLTVAISNDSQHKNDISPAARTAIGTMS